MTRYSWIHSPAVDGIFILGVPFFVVAVSFLFHSHFALPDSMTVVSWVILVLGVDVSHVYSTLYRTYLDPATRQRHGMFLYLLPFVVFVACMAIYATGAMNFWRVMAYLAVFHFARQQYGFMRVYARDEPNNATQRSVDTLAIYAATLYPVLDWHLTGPKNFHWFMKGDFMYFSDGGLKSVLLAAYVVIMALYTVRAISSRSRNLPKHLLLAGTALSWYTGIVFFNSDLAFTAINTVAHGIPYIALVWIWGNRTHDPRKKVIPGLFSIFRPRYVALFIASLLLIAYLEEGLWNVWVWHDAEHSGFFGPFHAAFADLGLNSPWLKIIVPLLSVPQITHYVIDGFIWKLRHDRYSWRDITLASPLHSSRAC